MLDLMTQAYSLTVILWSSRLLSPQFYNWFPQPFIVEEKGRVKLTKSNRLLPLLLVFLFVLVLRSEH